MDRTGIIKDNSKLMIYPDKKAGRHEVGHYLNNRE